MFEEMLTVVLFAMTGSIMRVIYGVYKAYTSFLDIRISKKRLLIEFLMSTWFGFTGGAFLVQTNAISIGIYLGTFAASILGPNVVDLIVKRIGFTKKIEVIVSDQQLGFAEFNQREMNALEYVKFKGKITNKIYQKINHSTHDVAKYELNALTKKGQLREVGRNKSTFYVSC